LWRKRVVAVADLVAQPLVHRERGSGSRQCLERALERVGVVTSELQIALELGSSEAVKEAVIQGAGVAVLSRRAVRAEVRAGLLKPIRVAGLTLDRDLYVVLDRRRVLPNPAERFFSLLGPEPEGSR
jgi:DNA-binding transcriptional LysR family regulator